MKNGKVFAVIDCLFILSGLSGCASPQRATPEPVGLGATGEVPDNHCRIIISRRQQLPGALSTVDLRVDGYPVGGLGCGASCTWEQPLDGSICIEASGAGHGTSEVIDAPAHGVYFFEVGWYGISSLEIRPITAQRALELLAGPFRPERWKNLKDVTTDLRSQRELRMTWTNNWKRLRKGMTRREVQNLLPGMSLFSFRELEQLGDGSLTIRSRYGTEFTFEHGQLEKWSPDSL
jgi:hypothetical protein